ncbi:hypothetical protein ACIBG8_07060 [Nonomuraea sp. NPDC050556]|uniref:hypothetical protein n=1 Tax=Nonomuraea sp. NPDC050556 TaxID=3364369 RepID=UPI00379D819B
MPARAADAMAEELQAALAALNVPAIVMGDAERAVCSLWPDLVARMDGRMIWWSTSRRSVRGRALWTFAWVAPTAAARLADTYRILRTRPLPVPLAELVDFALDLPEVNDAAHE